MKILSIIIPTKNREKTLDYAIQSCMSIIDHNDELEIIVQDCSDNDNTEQLIYEKYKSVVNYHRSYDSPSMNENWDRAILNSTGEYICGIGDDDGVLPHILSVTHLAKQLGITTIYQPMINYIWPDTYRNAYSNGKVSIDSSIESNIICAIEDVTKEWNRVISMCGFQYNHKLPNIYHGIVSRKTLDKTISKSGKYFLGTSLDVYSAIILSKATTLHAHMQAPFTIRGASKSSNTGRISERKEGEHYKEIKEYKRSELMPTKILSVDISVGETCEMALREMGVVNLIGAMDLSYVYGRVAASNLSLIRSLGSEYKRKSNQKPSLYYKRISIYLVERVRSYIYERIFFLIERVDWRLAQFLFKVLKRGGNRIGAENIVEAIAIYAEALPHASLSNNKKI